MFTVTCVVTHLKTQHNSLSKPTLLSFLEGFVSMELPGHFSYSANVNQEVLKEFPHVVGGVDLLHFHLSVDIAVVQEVDIGNLHLQGCD